MRDCAPTAPDQAARVSALDGTRGLAAACLPLIPAVLHLLSYRGLVQDMLIYVGRGLADRDSSGVGAVILFAHDGQSQAGLLAVGMALLGQVPVAFRELAKSCPREMTDD